MPEYMTIDEIQGPQAPLNNITSFSQPHVRRPDSETQAPGYNNTSLPRAPAILFIPLSTDVKRSAANYNSAVSLFTFTSSLPMPISPIDRQQWREVGLSTRDTSNQTPQELQQEARVDRSLGRRKMLTEEIPSPPESGSWEDLPDTVRCVVNRRPRRMHNSHPLPSIYSTHNPLLHGPSAPTQVLNQLQPRENRLRTVRRRSRRTTSTLPQQEPLLRRLVSTLGKRLWWGECEHERSGKRQRI